MTTKAQDWTCPNCGESTDEPETENLNDCPALDSDCTRVTCPKCGGTEEFHITGCGVGQRDATEERMIDSHREIGGYDRR